MGLFGAVLNSAVLEERAAIGAAVTLAAGVGSASASGAPAVLAGANVSPASANTVSAAHVPIIGQVVALVAAINSATASNAPAILAGVNVLPGTVVSLSGNPPPAVVGAGVNVSPLIGVSTTSAALLPDIDVERRRRTVQAVCS